MGIGSLVIKGAICGLLAGSLAGTFAFVFAEPVVDRAVALESQREQGDGAVQGQDSSGRPEIFSRPTQHGGLLVATTVLGTALGTLFGMLFYAVARRRRDASPWNLTLVLGGTIFLGYFLAPFLRYPANPPGTGLPSTIGQRSAATLLASLIGLMAVSAAWRVGSWLRARQAFQPVRHLAIVVVFVALVGAGYSVLPANTEPIDVPASLLWQFRILSVATQLLLWGTLAASFGFWVEWTAYRSRLGHAAATGTLRPS